MRTKDEKEKWLKPGERIDDLQCRGYDIIQNKDVFCFGMDAVLLADFATGAPNGSVIDLGTGTGVIPMLMQARGKGRHFTGLAVQAHSAVISNTHMIRLTIFFIFPPMPRQTEAARKIFIFSERMIL